MKKKQLSEKELKKRINKVLDLEKEMMHERVLTQLQKIIINGDVIELVQFVKHVEYDHDKANEQIWGIIKQMKPFLDLQYDDKINNILK